MPTRIERVIDEMKARGLQQFLLTDPHSIDYLSGVQVEPGERLFALLLRSDGKHRFFINKLFPLPETVIPISDFSDTDDSIALLAEFISPGEMLGIDKIWPARFLLPLMERAAAARYRDASICVDIVRALKDREEQELMRQASKLNDQVIEEVAGHLRVGMSELQVAEFICRRYVDLGAKGASFTPIVAFGDHAANPHHENSERLLEAGDVVLLDIGCQLNGYCSDMTRTYLTAEPEPRLRDVYELVRLANVHAEAMIKPGVRMHEIDAAARDVITAGGFGPQFTHRLGHFIGREVHEFGDVSSENDWVARPGMIFSIEPGIYLEGEFGVRIEDLVLVTVDGCEVLNQVSKDLTILILQD